MGIRIQYMLAPKPEEFIEISTRVVKPIGLHMDCEDDDRSPSLSLDFMVLERMYSPRIVGSAPTLSRLPLPISIF